MSFTACSTMTVDKPYFSSAFKRLVGSDGKPSYNFTTLYTQKEGSPSWNEVVPFSVQGEIVYADPEWATEANMDQVFQQIPDKCRDAELCKRVFERWLTDCSGAFTKPPTITQCMDASTMMCDSNVPTATVLESEENEDWVLQWIPTRIHVTMPNFYMYWAPCYKSKAPDARIPDLTTFETKIADFDIQQPEKTYTITPSTRQGEWLQEIPELQVPISDGPALRLDGDEEDPHMIKYRRRVHEARIKAKLARYRAERLAHRFEERYGFYPSEDDDEAQTEVDGSEVD
jgi:hypothetical protein